MTLADEGREAAAERSAAAEDAGAVASVRAALDGAAMVDALGTAALGAAALEAIFAAWPAATEPAGVVEPWALIAADARATASRSCLRRSSSRLMACSSRFRVLSAMAGWLGSGADTSRGATYSSIIMDSVVLAVGSGEVTADVKAALMTSAACTAGNETSGVHARKGWPALANADVEEPARREGADVDTMRVSRLAAGGWAARGANAPGARGADDARAAAGRPAMDGVAMDGATNSSGTAIGVLTAAAPMDAALAGRAAVELAPPKR